MAGTLQHLRSATLDKRPNPASMVDGQVAINYADGSPGLFFKDSNGDLVKVGPVHVGSTAPNATPAGGGTAGNSVGEQWLDTSGSTYVFKIWDGSAWRSEAGEFVNATGDTMTGALVLPSGTEGAPALGVGTTDNGLYSPGTDQVALATNGTGRLFIDANGNVGVNVSSPKGTTTAVGNIHLGFSSQIAGRAGGAGLYLSNNLYFTGDPSVNFSNAKYISSTFAGGILLSAGQFQFFNASAGTADADATLTERLRITSDGKLGLGTSDPRGAVHVGADLSSGATDAAAINLKQTSTTASTGIYLERNGERKGYYIYVGGDQDSLNFQRNNSGTKSDVLTLTRDGLVGIGTTSPGSALEIDAAAATSPFIAKINTSEAARIDSSGRLLVGTSTGGDVNYGGSTGGFHLVQGSADAHLMIRRAGGSGSLTLVRSNGTVAAPTVVADDDVVGQIRFVPYDGSDYLHQCAEISAEIDGTPGNDDVPGRLVFSVTADGSASPTEAMRIKNTRVINFSNAPVYADNAAAKTGGLVDGDVYRTSTGDLKIVYT